MYVPALAARAPAGATNVATGVRDASMALMMSRVAGSRPPGVSMRRIRIGAPRASAVARPSRIYSVVAGPMAPSTSSTRAGERGWAVATTASMHMIPANAAPSDETLAARMRALPIADRNPCGLLLQTLNLQQWC